MMIAAISDELYGVFALASVAATDTKCQFNPSRHCVMDVYERLKDQGLTDD
jgi:hypothetical protein